MGPPLGERFCVHMSGLVMWYRNGSGSGRFLEEWAKENHLLFSRAALSMPGPAQDSGGGLRVGLSCWQGIQSI